MSHVLFFFSSILYSNQSILNLSDVDAVEIIGPKSSVALRTLPLASVITGLQALVAEDMETLGKHSLFIPSITTGAA